MTYYFLSLLLFIILFIIIINAYVSCINCMLYDHSSIQYIYFRLHFKYQKCFKVIHIVFVWVHPMYWKRGWTSPWVPNSNWVSNKSYHVFHCTLCIWDEVGRVRLKPTLWFCQSVTKVIMFFIIRFLWFSASITTLQCILEKNCLVVCSGVSQIY